jgi:phosphoribosylanthranilate isomerase
MRTRVKICGFTCVEEAVYAAHHGVDAIGLVFYAPSPRCVTIAQAINITNALPAFTSVVALFVDATEAYIREILEQVPID